MKNAERREGVSDGSPAMIRTSSIRKGWEMAAPRYREGFGRYLEEVSTRLSELFSGPLSMPLLDLACGPGTAMAAIGRRHRAGVSIGCDFSHRMAGFAKKALPGSHGVVADQDVLPFAPNSFGTVLSSMGTIFSRDPEGQIKAIARLLKPGGQYGFSAWGLPEETALGTVSRKVVDEWPYPYDGTLPPLESPYSQGRSLWLERVALASGFGIRTVESHWLVFRFPDPLSAARALLGTGRFALLLSNSTYREPELLERTAQAFLPHRDPETGRVDLANRYHLYLLEKESF